MNEPNTNAEDYGAAGYCLFRDVLDMEEVRELKAELDALVRDMPDTMVVYKDGKIRRFQRDPNISLSPMPIITRG